MFGFQVFAIRPTEDRKPSKRKEGFTLITRRKFLIGHEEVVAYRLSNSVLLGDCPVNLSFDFQEVVTTEFGVGKSDRVPNATTL